MSHKFIFSASFHLLLVEIDRELSQLVQKQGCPCGGRLDQSNYPRSPMGVPSAFRPSYDERFSFCCNDCRKRITPASVRFFGRRWYPAPLLILISTLMLSINEYRLTQIKRHFGITVTESTWKRWRRWWRDVFTATPFWKQARGSIPEYPQRAILPRGILCVFQGGIDQKIILFLRFLSPITAGFLRAV